MTGVQVRRLGSVANIVWLGYHCRGVQSDWDLGPGFSGCDGVTKGQGQAGICGHCSVAGIPLRYSFFLLAAEGNLSPVLLWGWVSGLFLVYSGIEC